MNDAVVVLLTLGGSFVLALAVDRGLPNALESAAYLLEALAVTIAGSLKTTADTLRERHVHIQRVSGRRELPGGPVLQNAMQRPCNGR
jgi:hypothetical protein